MFTNLSGLNVEQLIEKQIELRQKLAQAHSMGMSSIAGQIQNMLEQVSIEIRTQSELQKLEADRQKNIDEGKDPDDDVLDIGSIE